MSRKLRSLILTALMVFSVFAGAVALTGSASATGNAGPGVTVAGNQEAVDHSYTGGGELQVSSAGNTPSYVTYMGDAGIQVEGTEATWEVRPGAENNVPGGEPGANAVDELVLHLDTNGDGDIDTRVGTPSRNIDVEEIGQGVRYEVTADLSDQTWYIEDEDNTQRPEGFRSVDLNPDDQIVRAGLGWGDASDYNPQTFDFTVDDLELSNSNGNTGDIIEDPSQSSTGSGEGDVGDFSIERSTSGDIESDVDANISDSGEVINGTIEVTVTNDGDSEQTIEVYSDSDSVVESRSVNVGAGDSETIELEVSYDDVDKNEFTEELTFESNGDTQTYTVNGDINTSSAGGGSGGIVSGVGSALNDAGELPVFGGFMLTAGGLGGWYVKRRRSD